VEETGGKVDTTRISRDVVDELAVGDLASRLLGELEGAVEDGRDQSGTGQDTGAHTT
jgi:hypothetical protein